MRPSREAERTLRRANGLGRLAQLAKRYLRRGFRRLRTQGLAATAGPSFGHTRRGRADASQTRPAAPAIVRGRVAATPWLRAGSSPLVAATPRGLDRVGGRGARWMRRPRWGGDRGLDPSAGRIRPRAGGDRARAL